jgi:uncharacterized protein YukE
MATRKKRTEKPPSASAAGRFTILLEQIQEQNRATIEAVYALEGKMERRFEEMRSYFEARLSVLEAAIRLNTEAIRKNSEDIRKNSEDIRKNSEDIQAVRRQLEELTGTVGGKVDASAFAQLEARVARLEERLGIAG